MTAWERVFHAALFEFGAVIFGVILASFFTEHSTGALTTVIILISVIAMGWNFIYNWIFDKIVTGERVKRGLGIRILHSVLFETGLMVFTLPLVMIMLNIGLWEAFVMDIGMTLFVLVYSVIFNWAYDHLRLKFIKTP